MRLYIKSMEKHDTYFVLNLSRPLQHVMGSLSDKHGSKLEMRNITHVYIHESLFDMLPKKFVTYMNIRGLKLDISRAKYKPKPIPDSGCHPTIMDDYSNNRWTDKLVYPQRCWITVERFNLVARRIQGVVSNLPKADSLPLSS